MTKADKNIQLKILSPLLILLGLISCNADRVFEDNMDFEEPYWTKQSVPEFTFEITDTEVAYNLYINVRNSMDYPFYNLYYQYEIKDSIGNGLSKDMLELILFDSKTGEPLGSGLGDLFDHQDLVVEDYQFETPGTYSIAFTHFMRTDTLPLILSVGARVEKATDQTAGQ